MSEEERKRRFGEDLALWKRDGFYGAPPGWNSESMAQLYVRAYKIPMDTLHRECANMNVIMVLHGEVMWTFRVGLERMALECYQELDESRHSFDRLHNCQILHYTRQNPSTGEISPHLDWMRSLCPWDLLLSHNSWKEIHRPSYTNDDLLAIAEQTPRLVNRTILE